MSYSNKGTMKLYLWVFEIQTEQFLFLQTPLKIRLRYQKLSRRGPKRLNEIKCERSVQSTIPKGRYLETISQDKNAILNRLKIIKNHLAKLHLGIKCVDLWTIVRPNSPLLLEAWQGSRRRYRLLSKSRRIKSHPWKELCWWRFPLFSKCCPTPLKWAQLT